MINVVVVSHRGAPVGQPLQAQFGPAGGTIGRAPTNTLVLDDPDRTVSRVHAQVECRGGQFFILDRGSNPLQHNGHPVGAGREVALAAGDRLVVGGFELSVQGVGGGVAAPSPAPATARAAHPSDDDPFADLLAGLGTPAPPAAAPAPKAAAPTPKVATDPFQFPDPMAHPAAAASPSDDPFADLLGSGASPPPTGSANQDLSGLGLLPGAASNIDELFGGFGGSGPGSDPFGDNSPLGAPLVQPNLSSGADPLASLQATPKPIAAPRSDHLPIGQFGYTPPKGVVPPGGASGGGSLMDDLGANPTVPTPLFGDLIDEPATSPSGRKLPAADADDDPFANLIPGPPPAAPASRPVAPSRVAPVAPPMAATPRAAPAPVAAAAAAAVSSAARESDDVLFAAFLRGVNSNHQMPTALTPELMERIGALLRTAAEGTLQLLHARQEVKRGVQAELTMIAAQANNPLKFSPSAEVALAHLLGAGVRGFMSPEEAMRDAYDDLRAHEFGVMVGMRAALAHVLARFTPAELEKKIVSKSAFDAFFSNRKAKLWDEFVSLYDGIAAEAEDDFHSLFGRAFVQAYDEQMARLKAGRR
ncbi:type VI secretion system-associated FHA domain protein TagH [Variovorax rhizosphaerae]|uniref:Type VI secretion system-associated FHA domain protein TagH n=1 Tax=Variovorax rhizosphaerae TaxID=1836200 RepID=A0ABU8WQV8_9BURK